MTRTFLPDQPQDVAVATAPAPAPQDENSSQHVNVNVNVSEPTACVKEDVKPAAAAAAPGKELAPSLLSWSASRPGPTASRRCNVGASEANREGPLPFHERSVGRASNLSTGSTRRAGLSTEEQEHLKAEEGRRHIHEQIERNMRSCHNAIHFPDRHLSEAAANRTGAVTIPDEFNLSQPSTPRGRSLSAERSKSTEWQRSLRGGTAGASGGEHSRSESRGRSWTPQLTVPIGPYLRTACRSRSHSRSSSVGYASDCGTPQRGGSEAGTPRRGRSRPCLSAPGTPVPQRELEAIDRHLDRITAGREGHSQSQPGSPRGRRMTSRSRGATPSPARSTASSGHGTPLRNRMAGTPGSLSVESRLSQLSQRTPSRAWPSSAQLLDEALQMKKQELKELQRRNDRNYKRAIEHPMLGGAGAGLSCNELTVPQGPELRTEQRAGRSRSASRPASASRSRSTSRQARADGGFSPNRSRCDLAGLEAEAASAAAGEGACEAATLDAATAAVPAEAAEREEWIRSAETAEDRAERARLVTQVTMLEEAKKEQARVCGVFRGAHHHRPASAAGSRGTSTKVAASSSGAAAAGVGRPNRIFRRAAPATAAPQAAQPAASAAAAEEAPKETDEASPAAGAAADSGGASPASVPAEEAGAVPTEAEAQAESRAELCDEPAPVEAVPIEEETQSSLVDSKDSKEDLSPASSVGVPEPTPAVPHAATRTGPPTAAAKQRSTLLGGPTRVRPRVGGNATSTATASAGAGVAAASAKASAKAKAAAASKRPATATAATSSRPAAGARATGAAGGRPGTAGTSRAGLGR